MIRGTYPAAIPRMGRRLSHVDIGGISGLTCWLESAWGVERDSSGNVAQWRDRSGRGNHAVQATVGARPTFALVGGRPAIQTTMTARFMTIPSSLDLSVSATLGGTVYIVADSTYAGANGFVVARWPAINDVNREWLIGINGGTTTAGAAYMKETGTGTERNVSIAQDCSTGAVRILRLRYDPTGPSIRAQAGGTAYGPTAIAGANIGGTGSVCIGRIYPTDVTLGIDANIRALLIFRRDLPTNEDVIVRNYLLQQHGAA